MAVFVVVDAVVLDVDFVAGVDVVDVVDAVVLDVSSDKLKCN